MLAIFFFSLVFSRGNCANGAVSIFFSLGKNFLKIDTLSQFDSEIWNETHLFFGVCPIWTHFGKGGE